MIPDTRAASNVGEVVPFLHVSNMEDSIRYYVDGLGFEIKHRWDVDGKLRWCWIALGGAAMMLQEFTKGRMLVPGHPAGNGVSLCFMCRDAIAIYHQARERGLDASEPEVGNGLWVTGLSDPDGYKLFFESPTDIPEDTKLSEWKG